MEQIDWAIKYYNGICNLEMQKNRYFQSLAFHSMGHRMFSPTLAKPKYEAKSK